MATGIIPKTASFIKLWTNPSPTSSFAPQTISIDLTNYDAVLIEAHNFRYDNSQYALSAVICLKGQTSFFLFGSASNNRLGVRTFSVSDSGVVASEATYNATAQNEFGVPHEIYGIRW